MPPSPPPPVTADTDLEIVAVSQNKRSWRITIVHFGAQEKQG